MTINFYLFWTLLTIVLLLILGGLLIYAIKENGLNDSFYVAALLSLLTITVAFSTLFFSMIENAIFSKDEYQTLRCIEIIGKYKIQRDWFDEKDRIITEDDVRYFVHYPQKVDSVYLLKKVKKKWLGFVDSGEEEVFTIPTTDKEKVKKMNFSACSKKVKIK